jgi:hypothetical protein
VTSRLKSTSAIATSKNFNPSPSKGTWATVTPIRRKIKELAMKAANSQKPRTNSRSREEKVLDLEPPNAAMLPIRRPAATVANMPEHWKYSASKNEP